MDFDKNSWDRQKTPSSRNIAPTKGLTCNRHSARLDICFDLNHEKDSWRERRNCFCCYIIWHFFKFDKETNKQSHELCDGIGRSCPSIQIILILRLSRAPALLFRLWWEKNIKITYQRLISDERGKKSLVESEWIFLNRLVCLASDGIIKNGKIVSILNWRAGYETMKQYWFLDSTLGWRQEIAEGMFFVW